ncbi:hypothetical protein [Neisseria sp. P0014.S009]|uniref:hypothetical protein n=1 Tax=unclassified Neisseria TaxID=2623750 RepID=UPI003F8063E7
MSKTLSLFEYPELAAVGQIETANSVLGSLMEEPILYVPAYSKLAGDTYAGYFLSWFLRNCPYGQSIKIRDEDMLEALGLTVSRWHSVRRLLKQLKFLNLARSDGHTVYSLNESDFSEALREQDNRHQGDRAYGEMPSVPLDRLCTAAMLRSGLKINDVLFYFAVQAQQRYLTPDKRGEYSEWIPYNEEQANALAMLSHEDQQRSMKALDKAGLIESGRHPLFNITVFRLNYQAMANLSWQYLHGAGNGGI